MSNKERLRELYRKAANTSLLILDEAERITTGRSQKQQANTNTAQPSKSNPKSSTKTPPTGSISPKTPPRAQP